MGGDNFVAAIFILCVTAVIVLGLGEPDLLDAIISRVMVNNG